MVSPASFEEVATRYAPYIQELRDFFTGRNLRFGSPQDIIPFAERLGPPSFFRDEMASMVRAIVFREQEGISRPELLELIAIAIGGPQIENRATDLQRSLDQVSDFLASALRSLWGTVPDELPEDLPQELPQEPPQEAHQEAPQNLPPEPAQELPRDLPKNPGHNPPHTLPQILAQALPPNLPSEPAPLRAGRQTPPTPDAPARDTLAPFATAATPDLSTAEPTFAAPNRAVWPKAPTPDAAPKAPSPGPAAPNAAAPTLAAPASLAPEPSVPTFAWTASGDGIFSRALSLSREPSTAAGHDEQHEHDAEWRLGWITAVCAVVLALAALAYVGWNYRANPAVPDQVTESQPPPPDNAPDTRSGTSRALTSGSPERPLTAGSAAARPGTPEHGSTRAERALERRDARGTHLYSREDHAASSASAVAAAERAEQNAAFDSGDSPSRGSRLTPPGRLPKHDDEGVFFVSSGVMTGNLLSAPAPNYPKLARLAGVQGPVVIQVVVSPEGGVSATRVLSGHWMLRSAAEHAVRTWTYRPYITRGRATNVSTIVTIDFRLHR